MYLLSMSNTNTYTLNYNEQLYLQERYTNIVRLDM